LRFDCYCRNGAGELSKSVSEAEAKMPMLGSDISEGEAKKKQLVEDLKNHRSARSAAKSAMEADFAADRADRWFFKSSTSCFFFASPSDMSDPSMGILASASETLLLSSPAPFRQ
jgi:outer membrane murein-binding lipoprotein Lpp